MSLPRQDLKIGYGKRGGRQRVGQNKFGGLREVKRFDFVDSRRDVADRDWIPTTRLAQPRRGVRASKRATRQRVKHRFLMSANNVIVLPASHRLEEEARQFNQFLKQLKKFTTPQITDDDIGARFIETEAAIWLLHILRFKTSFDQSKTAAMEGNHQEYWLNYCSTLDMTTASMQYLLSRQPTKPICLIVGNRLMRKGYGHSVVLVILPTPEGLQALIKDSMCINETNLKTHCRTLLMNLNIKIATVVGALDFEESVTNTDCLRECYKEVGSILDGNQFWNRCLVGFKKVYDVNSWKQIE